MVIEQLSEQEQDNIYQCLCAAELKEFYPEREFRTLFGITRHELTNIRKLWPAVDTKDPVVDCAVVGAMNHLLLYPHKQMSNWNLYFSCSPEAVEKTLLKYIHLTTGVLPLDGKMVTSPDADAKTTAGEIYFSRMR